MLNDNFFDNSLFILIRCRVFISQIVEKYFEKMFYFPLFFKHGRKPFTKFHYFPCRSQPIEAEPLMSTYSDLYLTLSCPKIPSITNQSVHRTEALASSAIGFPCNLGNRNKIWEFEETSLLGLKVDFKNWNSFDSSISLNKKK